MNPPRPNTFKPDYGVEHWTRKTTMTPLGWIVAVVSVFALVFGAVRNF